MNARTAIARAGRCVKVYRRGRLGPFGKADPGARVGSGRYCSDHDIAPCKRRMSPLIRPRYANARRFCARAFSSVPSSIGAMPGRSEVLIHELPDHASWVASVSLVPCVVGRDYPLPVSFPD